MYIGKQNLLHTIQSHPPPLFSPFLLDIVVNFFPQLAGLSKARPSNLLTADLQ